MRRPFFASFRKLPLVIFFLLCGGTLAVSAETLQKYREGVAYIRGQLTYLYSTSPDDYDNTWSEKDQLEAEAVFFAELAEYLPPRETVEWSGLSLEVDNRWLHRRLDEIKKRRAVKGGAFDVKEHDAIITEMDARLLSLEAKFTELEKLAQTNRNKDAEKQKLDEILKRAEYKPPAEKEKSALERWQQAFLDWLRDLLPRSQPADPNLPPASMPAISPAIVQILIVFLALAVLAFVIWRFLPVFSNRRRTKKDKKEKRERIILGEKLGEDESSLTLFGQAEVMAREGNFRGAIRKGYIAMLCELGDRKIVRLAQHKTNHDYLRDLKKDIDLHGDVRDLTFLFENHWYGLAAASEDEWSKFREHYRHSTARLS